MRLKTLTIERFKRIERVDFNLCGVNILIGGSTLPLRIEAEVKERQPFQKFCKRGSGPKTRGILRGCVPWCPGAFMEAIDLVCRPPRKNKCLLMYI